MLHTHTYTYKYDYVIPDAVLSDFHKQNSVLSDCLVNTDGLAVRMCAGVRTFRDTNRMPGMDL